MNWVILRALISHWRHVPLQLFTLLAGLALATALWSGVQAINAEARASYAAAAETLGEGNYRQVVSVDGQDIPVATYVDLRRAGWMVSPVIEGRLDGVRLIGIDPLTAPQTLAAVQALDDLQVSDTNTIWVAPDVTLTLPNTVQIVSETLAPNTAVADIAWVADHLERQDISRLILTEDRGLILPPGLRFTEAGTNDLASLTDSFHLNLTAFGLLAFAVGIFIANGAVGLAFEQRRPLVRTLRAMGAPLVRIMWLMWVELAILSTVAGFLGVALGYGVAALLLPDVSATLRGLYGADVAGTLTIRPIWWISGLLMAIFGGMIAAATSFWSMSRMPILGAAQRRAWAVKAGKGRVWTAVIGAVLWAVAWAGTLSEPTLIQGFGVLAGLLLGAAMLLPAALAVILRVGQALARGAVAQWFWADTRQQLPGLSLALAALLLAMTANIGVSTMVSSFRLTFVAFLNQRLASELYVTANDASEAQRLEQWLTPYVDAVLPIDQVVTQVLGETAEIYGPVDHPTYRENWRMLRSVDDPWARVHAGQGVLINEQLAYRLDLEIGSNLAVSDTNLPVVGIYGDYGNPIGQIILGRRVFKSLYPASQALRFGLRLPPHEVPALTTRLIEEFGLSPDSIIDQSALKSYSLGIFERTFTVTAALNVLTLAVAGFAMLMSLLTLAGLRLPQLAPVWAMGLTRRELGLLELARAVMLAFLTGVLAVPLGLALAWVLLSIVNVAAFGWQLPMFVFPASYAVLLAQALVAAVVAAGWPAFRLIRTAPDRLLRVFANER